MWKIFPKSSGDEKSFAREHATFNDGTGVAHGMILSSPSNIVEMKTKHCENLRRGGEGEKKNLFLSKTATVVTLNRRMCVIYAVIEVKLQRSF